ncbi:hypothetical protein FQZ97_835010 [compost metagenome]
MAIAPALVDAVGDGEEDLGLGNAAGHGVGEKDVAAVGDHAVERGHDLGQRGLEALHADLAACRDVVPVELVFGPGLERELAQHFRGRGGAGGGVHVKTGHERHVDDLAAQVGFARGELLVGQRAQRAVGFAAAHGDADDAHARLARFVDEPVGIATAEKLTEQHEHVAGAKDVFLGELIQSNGAVHVQVLAVFVGNPAWEPSRVLYRKAAQACEGPSGAPRVHQCHWRHKRKSRAASSRWRRCSRAPWAGCNSAARHASISSAKALAAGFMRPPALWPAAPAGAFHDPLPAGRPWRRTSRSCAWRP